MATAYNPTLVTNGLVYALDVKNIKCYPGSGTDVFDLSKNPVNGTLSNGLTVTDGLLVFDGLDDQVDLGTIPTGNKLQLSTASGATGLTIQFFAKNSATGGDSFQRVVDKSTGGNSADGYGIWFYSTFTPVGQFEFSIDGQGSGGGLITGSTADTGLVLADGYQNFAITHDYTSTTQQWYKNGVAGATRTTAAVPPDVAAKFTIGSWYADAGREWDDGIGPVLIYNRALTQSEVTQNYNAVKGRFGL